LALLLMTGCASSSSAPSADQQSQTLVSAMRSHPIVLLGEVHDNAAQHALRAKALKVILEDGARPALLMEQFDRERQGAIDAALSSPMATVDEVIAAGAPDKSSMQGWTWSFYRPYIALAIQYRLPLIAANVSRNDTRGIVKDGLSAHGFDATVPADIEAAQSQAIVDGHCGMIDAAQARPLVGAQVARDQFMARSIEANAARGAVLLAGNGHVRSDVGVPRWLTPATRARSVSIGLLEAGDPDQTSFGVTVTTQAQSRPDPCEGMRAPPKKG
jgi:uncharacterized iron-regulated protein